MQLERTALAWRRTVLALVVASLAGVRVLFGTFGYAAIGLGAAGIAVALLLRAMAGRRVRAEWSRLSASGESDARLPGGLPLALCTVVVLAMGLLALVFALLG